MRWYLKVIRQAAVTHLPFGTALRNLKRQHFGYKPDPDNLLGTLANLEEMEAALHAAGRSFEGASVMEIGSGWFPTIPILLALKGAKHVFMTDLTPHMDPVTFAASLHFLKTQFPDHKRLHDISRLEDLPITYLSPFHAGEIRDGSIDVIISRTVLEHIPQLDLIRLFQALHPKLAKEGLMVHAIDYSDHLEHGDKSISKINFLTWPERSHALVNRLMNEGENRLRHHEYPAIFRKAGFNVLTDSRSIHEPTRSLAKSLPLIKPYCDMTAEQLATMHGIYVLVPE